MIGNFLCSTLLCCIGLTATLDFLPASREIQVMDKGEYRFGLVKNENSAKITMVTYSSDNGIKGSFVVEKDHLGSRTSWMSFVEPNQVTNLGKEGLPQLMVKKVSETGTKLWTLIPKEGEKVLEPVVFKVNFLYNAPTVVKTCVAVEGASFLQFITLPNKQWKKCILKFDDVEIDLSIQTSEAYIFLTSFGESKQDISERVKSLGRGLCGLQLVNATIPMSAVKEWSLTAIDNLDTNYRGIFNVVVYEKPNTSLAKKVVVGDWAIWECGVQTNDQSYCAIYNPEGKLIQDGRTCLYETETVSMHDIGKWTCVTGNRKSMETEDYSLNTNNQGTEMVETWVREDDKYFMLGCKLTNSPYKSLTFCRMVAPNNKVFNILPGGATKRYVSLGTNFDESTCAIEIEKPLTLDENGLWRCEMNAGVSDVTGGFLNVGEVKRPDYLKLLRITTQLNKPFRILCEVPYSSEYCHIRAPNGTIYQTESSYRTRLGRCSYSIDEASVSDNGMWSCSFAREMGVPDEEIGVEVIIAEALVYYSEIQIRSGDTAVLMCSSGGLPLNYCRFISPSGKAYYIHNQQASKTISYSGKGLQYGDCGISINTAHTSDSGMWTCVTRIGARYKQPEITARINLVVSPNYFGDPNIAAAVGLSVGIVIVSAIAGLIVFRKWRQRKNNLRNSSQTRLINEIDAVSLNVSEAPPNQSVLTRDQGSHEHQP